MNVNGEREAETLNAGTQKSIDHGLVLANSEGIHNATVTNNHSKSKEERETQNQERMGERNHKQTDLKFSKGET